MNSKFRNIFLVFGVVAVVIMLFTFDVSYDDLLNNLRPVSYTHLTLPTNSRV